MADREINEYHIGQRPTLEAAFTDEDGNPADPTTVECWVKEDEDGAPQSVTVANPAVGTYRAQYTIVNEVRHYYRFAGTGTIVAADEWKFDVAQSAFN